ncbi:MAG: hypothetical protein HZB67_03070 [Candidatus Aenigmarchaeota archaeon]|nr:hypothetical protein [Candidatus Aenigmarchaeota archaeon]
MKKNEMELRWNAIKLFLDKVIKNPEEYPNKALIFVWPPEEISTIFSKEKLRLIDIITKRKPKTISNLAKLVDREISAVDRDLKLLEKYDIVRLERKGRTVKPIIIKEIMVLPLVNIEPRYLHEMNEVVK